MTIYLVNYYEYGSYEDGCGRYFTSMEKALHHCRENGFYRKDGEMLTSPFSGKTMLKVGDFLIDVTKKWMNDESFNDEDIWQIMCDFMTISEVTVH